MGKIGQQVGGWPVQAADATALWDKLVGSKAQTEGGAIIVYPQSLGDASKRQVRAEGGAERGGARRPVSGGEASGGRHPRLANGRQRLAGWASLASLGLPMAGGGADRPTAPGFSGHPGTPRPAAPIAPLPPPQFFQNGFWSCSVDTCMVRAGAVRLWGRRRWALGCTRRWSAPERPRAAAWPPPHTSRPHTLPSHAPAPAPPQDKDIDDVGFLEQVVGQLPGRFQANPKRVFVSGKSAGGVLVHAALCKCAGGGGWSLAGGLAAGGQGLREEAGGEGRVQGPRQDAGQTRDVAAGAAPSSPTP
jgi:hypothetical protein